MYVLITESGAQFSIGRDGALNMILACGKPDKRTSHLGGAQFLLQWTTCEYPFAIFTTNPDYAESLGL